MPTHKTRVYIQHQWRNGSGLLTTFGGSQGVFVQRAWPLQAAMPAAQKDVSRCRLPCPQHKKTRAAVECRAILPGGQVMRARHVRRGIKHLNNYPMAEQEQTFTSVG